MKVYTGAGLGDIYGELLRDVSKHGRDVVVRGKRRTELPEPVVLEYTRPGYCWMSIPGRKFNPFFMLAEIVWILSGNGSVDWISFYNSNMRNFSDGHVDFHGAYGRRMRAWSYAVPGSNLWRVVDQIEQVVRKLTEDPNSTQAVISLWDPVRDNLEKSKDYPCNNTVYYSLREGTLSQTVVIRSNDLIWGTPHNAIQFTHLHAYVASQLGAKMGKFTYFIQNLHYYVGEYDSTLGNLLEQAHQGDAMCEAQSLTDRLRLVPYPAEVEEAFRTLNRCVAQIKRPLDSSAELPAILSHLSVGYWTDTICLPLVVFNALKMGVIVTAGNVNLVINRLGELPNPLPYLISEFWKESKDPIAREIAAAL